MARRKAEPLGSIVWRDLTVPNADEVQRFYSDVVGWKAVPFDGDFNMMIPGKKAPIAGVCNAKGANAKLPPQWLMYVTVENLARSVRIAKKRGGTVLDGPRGAGGVKFCVIRDPAGAAIALFQQS